ncbi:hypothetical protein SELR_17950 [Selenomonas ruminantium subsp. lactilytica TAM6421]|uniref:Uncharacterized protein n=1 Tax=Selenomonas ruminantium subsp. lactilytica (strain NBRC 103574 / TAM6421) TaxID=927704 RepID=I0GRW6_SELRL|nr:hypothetical protein [Selenomonas ruminantium]BAL83503.1 hypothetical protein SELR_17950 [Selenomonas ruminantium subsp. lactilytica TAM6421]
MKDKMNYLVTVGLECEHVTLSIHGYTFESLQQIILQKVDVIAKMNTEFCALQEKGYVNNATKVEKMSEYLYEGEYLEARALADYIKALAEDGLFNGAVHINNDLVCIGC